MDLAREAKEQGWWKAFPDVGLALVPYIGLEQDASSITSFAAFYVPALLQTADYVRAIVKGIAPRIEPRGAEGSGRNPASSSGHPREEIIRLGIECSSTSLCCTARRAARRSWSRRLTRSSNLSTGDKVIAQVVPFDVGVLAAQDSNFVLLEFDDRDLAPVVFVEGLQNGQMFEKEVDVARYRESIDYLRDSALTTRDTKARLVQMRKAYESAIR